ncbi:hypothetical protein [Salarchaeum japonicum]|uniref:Uncharacterized protein n=1 Tax=Salarchaeum japonicum TaxID=555573 RepID=A0AAV3SZ11_9EURY|nr:hypothetical protein [Salarchaeum japonicum]
MTNVRNLTRDLKTRKKDVYAELSPQIGGAEEGETYPFSTGFGLFSASLVIGYIEDDGELIEEEADRRYNSDEESETSGSPDDSVPAGEDDPYHRFTDINQVLDNNEDHAYTIELIDRIIAIELASHSDNENEEIPENVWNLVVAHADEGVEIIKEQWDSQTQLDLERYFDQMEDFWQEKIEDISDDLTQIPTREDDGRIQTGD